MPSFPTIRLATPADFDEVVDVLCDAFFDYPVMRFVVGSVGDEYSHRLRRLIAFFSTARFLRDEPVLALFDEGRMLGVADLARPQHAAPAELEAVGERLWEELGPAARQRYEAFGEATATVIYPEPRLHLMMIGVRGEAAGRGLGRRLLEAVHELSADDPGSAGVSLTTEVPGNVPLYEHFGYRVVGQTRVADELDSWGMYRPDA